MALTATHFPQHGLTFAILFGCPLSIEVEIIRRLSRTMIGAGHPLLLPGIFAELERSRHNAVVEKMIDQLESRIYALDFAPNNSPLPIGEEREQIHRDKREDFLDTAYLKNGLISWRNQLHKMAKYGKLLDGTSAVNNEPTSTHPRGIQLSLSHTMPRHERPSSPDYTSENSRHGPQLHKTGQKITDRLENIIEEYDDKIRDCTMRLDGMAMATQWVRSRNRFQDSFSPTAET